MCYCGFGTLPHLTSHCLLSEKWKTSACISVWCYLGQGIFHFLYELSWLNNAENAIPFNNVEYIKTHLDHASYTLEGTARVGVHTTGMSITPLWSVSGVVIGTYCIEVSHRRLVASDNVSTLLGSGLRDKLHSAVYSWNSLFKTHTLG